MGMHYEGWIKLLSNDKDQLDRDKEFLGELDIEVGEFNSKENRFENCVVPASVHAQVTMLLGRFELDLEAIQTKEDDDGQDPDTEQDSQ